MGLEHVPGRGSKDPVARVETMVLSGNCEKFKMAGILEVGSSKRCRGSLRDEDR